MKYIFFLMLTLVSIVSSVHALQIEYQSASKNTTNVLPWAEMMSIKQHIYIDFWKNISEKKHHFVEIFPEHSESYIPTQLPANTPEWEYIKSLASPERWSRLWNSYPTMEKTQKVRLFTYFEKWQEDKQDNTLPTQTNTTNTLYYVVESSEDSIQNIRISPIETQWYRFLGWNGLEWFSLKGNFDDIQENSDIPMPPLVMLGSDLDIYDMEIETDTDNFVRIFTPKSRKLLLTHFTPDYTLAHFGEIQQDLFSLLPYYEVDIPLKKGYNTVRITYQSFTRIPESIKETLRVEK